MTMLPILPVLPDETITSYLRRVAKFHVGMGDVYSFLGALNLSRTAVIDPSSETLARIGDITGQSRATLHRMVIRSVQPRIRALGEAHFHTEFANLKQTTFCPACLLEDTVPGSASNGLRVGRVSWRLAPVRTCSKHHIALVRATMTTKSHRFQHMDEVAPEDSELARLVDTAERRPPSALQSYVEDRLAGLSGPAWLDAQPIDLAARACEMLGLLMSQPVKRKMPAVSDADLNTAGAVGFAQAAEGEAGIRAVLEAVHENSKAAGGLGGHSQVFGFFSAWLQDVGKLKPKGLIQGITRDYILDHFAIKAGTTLFGEVVDRERMHSAYTLARKLGSNAGTVHRALVYAGLLDTDAKRPSKDVVCNAVEAEALFTGIHKALSNRELRKFLNCHRTQAEQLVNAGILPQVIAKGDRGQNAAQHVARDAAETFLRNMVARAQPVDTPTEGMLSITHAARASGWSVVDIVRVLLAGRLTRVEYVDPGLGFMAVLVDAAEVSAVLRQEVSGDLVSFDEAARLLGIKRYGVRKFLRLRDRAGKPFLNIHSILNAAGRPVEHISREGIDRFLESHVALVDIAARQKSHPKATKERLAAANILPAIDVNGIGRTFYRRADAASITAP